jgi:hypothetical protein
VNLNEDPKEIPAESIALNYIRDPKTGNLTQIRCVPFEPGMVIIRGKHRYHVDAKGTQRRIA